MIFTIELYKRGIMVFANLSYIAGSILIVGIYALLLYKGFRNSTDSWKKSPTIWICIGLLIYFGCCIPYLSMIHYLQVNYPKLNTFLYHLIIDQLSNIRYAFMAIAFWLVRKNTQLKINTTA